MKLIPVIDIQAGQVVAACGGRRDGYQPLQTPLAYSSEPIAVVDGLRTLYRFDTIYVADLDAIKGGPAQIELLSELMRSCPQLEFWLDAGAASATLALPQTGGLRRVFGSESFTANELESLFQRWPDALLSLDFDAHGLRGDPRWLAATADWPQTVIVMELAAVGSRTGPALVHLKDLHKHHPERCYYAAGGIRDDADLLAVAAAGGSGALLATALHHGSVTICRQ